MSEPLANLLLVSERLFHAMCRGIERQIDMDMPRHGLSGIQALLLHRMGGQSVRQADILALGYYGRTNPSYNLACLRKLGFTQRAVSANKRDVFVQVTSRGSQVAASVERYFARKVNSVTRYAAIGPAYVAQIADALERIDRGLAAESGFVG